MVYHPSVLAFYFELLINYILYKITNAAKYHYSWIKNDR